jgi:hypothetical protein
MPTPINSVVFLDPANSIGNVSGTTLNLLGIVAGSNITITQSTNDFIISGLNFANGGGSGAVGIVIVEVNSATLNTAGSGYLVGDTIVAIGGTYTSQAAISVLTTTLSGGIATFLVTIKGAYSAIPTNPVSTAGGSGNGATFNFLYDILAVNITVGGTGYVFPPSVTFSGGSGAGVLATSTLVGSSVGSVTVVANGSGYTSIPSVSFSAGISLIESIAGSTITLNSIAAGPGVGITSVNGVITFTASPQGTSTGPGLSIYGGSVGGVQQFLSLVAGTGIALTSSGTSITIASSSAAGAFQNIGPGAGVFAQEVGGTAQFKSLVPGQYVTITPMADRIVIDAPGSVANGINLDSPNLNEIFVGLQAGTSTLMFRGLMDGVGMSIVNTGNSLQLNAVQPLMANLGTPNDGQAVYQSSAFNALTNQTTYNFSRILGGQDILTTSNGTSITVNATNNIVRLNQPQVYTAQQSVAAQTLQDSSTIAWNLNDGNVAILTLLASLPSRMITNAVNQVAGGIYYLMIKNTGGSTITWGTTYFFTGGTPPGLSPGASDVTVIQFISDGTNMYGQVTFQTAIV